MSNATSTDDTITWDDPNIPAAIIVSVGAGLATGIGGALVFVPDLLKKMPQMTVLAISLALSAGVMIYVSFIEIFGKSQAEIACHLLEDRGGDEQGRTCDDDVQDMSEVEGAAAGITTLCFFAGMLFCVLLEVLVHKMSGASGDDLHASTCPAHGGIGAVSTTTSEGGETEKAVAVEIVADGASKSEAKPQSGEAEPDGGLIGNASLQRMGIMTALAIAVHNFPEGLATFMATLDDTKVGAGLGVAIAIHNIPEGLCVAMPIYYASGSKCKAFFWSLLSGVTEPIGGILGFAALQPVFTPMVFGVVFSMVGGMMVFIACHELIPAAHKYMQNQAKATMWFIIGMAVMALSLVLFVL
jgi:ZIP family zinc transporter